MTETIQKYDFKAGLPQEFEILDLAQLYKEMPTELTTPHRAEFYQILWFQKGKQTHMVDFCTVEVQPNTLVFISKNSVQQFDSSGTFEGKILVFTDNFYCETNADTKFLKSTILFNDLFTVSTIKIPEKATHFNTILQLLSSEFSLKKDQFQTDILRNLLHTILLFSERERRTQDFTEIKKSDDLDIILLFKELLEAQFNHQKMVANYANQLHITKKRLNKATSNILGKTPKQLIDERILLEAKRLLVHTAASIKEIGFDLGFDEPTNFVKYFKKHISTTPLEFREDFLY